MKKHDLALIKKVNGKGYEIPLSHLNDRVVFLMLQLNNKFVVHLRLYLNMISSVRKMMEVQQIFIKNLLYKLFGFF